MERIEWLEYVFEAFGGAWMRAWTKVGLGVNFSILVLTIVYSGLMGWSLPTDLRAVVFLLTAFVLAFIGYLTWEFQLKFPRIMAQKRNTMHGAEIVITNKEIDDLTDLEVELFKRVWVSKSGQKIDFKVKPEGRLFEIVDAQKVPYDGGTKVVLIGSGKNETATFHLQNAELDTGFETEDGGKTDIAVYEMIIRVKGRLKGRTIYPRWVIGRLSYQRSPQEFPEYEGLGRVIGTIPNIYSRMEWRDPDYPGQNFAKSNRR